MNRVFLATPDQDESEWFSDELKEYGRIVRTIDSLDFFVPQWESVEANVVIFMESIIHSEDAFQNLIEKIRSDRPATTIMFIYHRKKDTFINNLNDEGIFCVSYLDLEPGLVEACLAGVSVLPYQIQSNSELEAPLLDFEHEQNHVPETIPEERMGRSGISEVAKGFTRQLTKTSSKLFYIIENKKTEIKNQKDKHTVKTVTPEELDFSSIIKNNQIKKKERFVGTAVIALTGTERGVGTTHIAIMIANYLARLEYSVALVEANESNDYLEIEAAYEGVEDSRQLNTLAFNIHGVKYIKNVNDLDMVHLLSGSYSFIILDLGYYQNTDWYEEFLRANITIVVGSGSEWKQKHLYRFFHEQIHHDQTKWKLCVPFANKQVIKDIKKKLPKRKIYGIPFHPDPYQENEHADIILEDILKLNHHQKLTLIKKKFQSIFY
ncbi:hypothetical protein P4K96_22805 [Bacillus cereus]|uniref:hypothetical protein n=1 Tax=Paenibacillus melissococcoides TaxID=2912268 RepID=UPI0021C2FC68|nr:hypothetical protein [Paenibacillus melissococcoides]MEB9896276.1 hypothetical protein [Bacillus cereus]CAH8721293.1 hypothetical protein HTL2_006286 [Paenibacillus melissococcoides]